MSMRICALLLCFFVGANGALVRIEMKDRSEVLNGHSFGKSGAYERVRGKAYFAVDPKAAANRGIVDLDKAPRNSAGSVEFSADLYMLKPRDPARGNRTILYEAPNRGGKGMLGMFNRASSSMDPTSAEHFGDGLLLDAGYTLVWLGWQSDVPMRRDILRLDAPVAKGVKGWVRSEFTPDRETTRFSLGDSGHVPYPVLNPDELVLTVRDGIRGNRQPIDPTTFRIENKTEVVLEKPAAPGRIYEAVYQSTDPAIAGLGLAGIRDLISFLKYGSTGKTLDHAIGFGTSQSAMLLKALIYEGFNADEKGRRVFDGILAHVAGGRRSIFQRFTQHSRTAGPLRNSSFSGTDQFPFADVTTTDPKTGLTDGLLARALKSNTVPKIVYTNSSYEYWGSVGALLHTTVDGEDDLALPATSRIYMLAGGQHGPASFPPSAGRGQNLANFNDYRWIHRALLERLQAWVSEGKEPPPSAFPSLSSKTLVRIRDYSFPAIPDVIVPRMPHISERLDFGPSYRKAGIIDHEPPRLGLPFAALIPQANADGNDISGVKMPWVTVPLGTFTGWNLRATKIGASTELLGQTGSYIPFPATKQTQIAARDPRPSIEERYSGESDYLAKVREAGMSLARSGFLLERDIPAVMSTAKRYWDWSTQPARASRD
jgi:hypothetical protein